MSNLPEKITPEEGVNLVLSFGDINLVSNLFQHYGWSMNEEIKEVLYIARQSTNLPAKLNALKYLRELIKETMEMSGYTAKVSKTVQGLDGSQTTFSSHGIVSALNPTKRIEVQIEDKNNGTEKQEQSEERSINGIGDREQGDRGDSIESNEPIGIGCSPCSGGIGSNDAGPIQSNNTDSNIGADRNENGEIGELQPGQCDNNPDGHIAGNSCYNIKPPRTNVDLYPGISGNRVSNKDTIGHD